MQIQPPPEKFLSTLLEIRNYYAPLVDKYGKLYREALENFTHAQALLSNWGLQESANSNGSVQLTEEILTLPAENDTHPQAKRTEPKLAASNVNELSQVNNITTAGISSPNQVNQGEENLFNGRLPDVAPDENSSDEVANLESPPAINALVTATKESDIKEDTDSTPETAPKLAPNGTAQISPQASQTPIAESSNTLETATTPNKDLFGQEIPMVGEYESLNRTEAIEKLLQQRKGSVCQVDFIVRSLYGELEPKAKKVVRGRVQSTLTYGKENGKWSLVPGQPGYYTIDLKSLNSKNKNSSSKSSKTPTEKPAPQAQVNVSEDISSGSSQTQANISTESSSAPSQTQAKKPSPQAKANVIPMKGEFEGKFLIDAITSLLEKNPRKVFDTGEVIDRLYGRLSPEQTKQVRPGVLNELSRGFRTGRFSRVPEEKGLYIWDAKLLPD